MQPFFYNVRTVLLMSSIVLVFIMLMFYVFVLLCCVNAKNIFLLWDNKGQDWTELIVIMNTDVANWKAFIWYAKG